MRILPDEGGGGREFHAGEQSIRQDRCTGLSGKRRGAAGSSSGRKVWWCLCLGGHVIKSPIHPDEKLEIILWSMGTPGGERGYI